MAESMVHSYEDQHEYHEPPLDPNSTTQARSFEYRGSCTCGWVGPWRNVPGLMGSSRAARADYVAHVEAQLGAKAFYDAPCACRNCGSQHVQPIAVGLHVSGEICARCGTGMVQPDNETWHESRAATQRWFP